MRQIWCFGWSQSVDVINNLNYYLHKLLLLYKRFIFVVITINRNFYEIWIDLTFFSLNDTRLRRKAISSAVGTAIIPHFTHLTSNVHAHHPTSHKLQIEFDLFSRHVRFFVLGPVSPFFRLLFVACVKSRLTHVIFSNIHEICHNMMFESSYRDRDHPYVMFTFQAVPTNIFV